MEKHGRFPLEGVLAVLLRVTVGMAALCPLHTLPAHVRLCAALYVSIYIVQILAGKAKAKQASDDSSEASSEEYGEDDDEEEGKYEIEEDEEELEDNSDSDGK